MAYLRGIAIILLLLLSNLIFPYEFDNSADDSENLDEQVTSRADEKPISRSPSRQSTSRQSCSRLPQDDAHGGSWLDSFEDDSGVDWSMSDHLRLEEGDAEINIKTNLDPNTAAMWHFDEGSGTTAFDETDNNNDGTINGATWTNGKYSKALSFDGVDDYVDCGNDDSLDITNDITISAWVKANQWHDTRPDGVIDKGIGLDAGYAMATDSAETSISFMAPGLSGGNVPLYPWKFDTGITPSTGTWHYLLFTYDGSFVKFYLDGEEKFSRSASGTITSGTYDLYIGTFVQTPPIINYHFDGLIDDVGIYNRALSALEIKDLYENGTGFKLVRQANLTSSTINLPQAMHWDTLLINKTEPTNTYINVTILNASNNQPIPGSPTYTDNGEVDISYIDPVQYSAIKLNATFEGDGSTTPELHSWAVSWNRSNTWQDTLFGGEKVESSENVEAVDGDVQLEHGGIDSSAVAVWHFDEGSGTTAYDSTEYNNNGTLLNGVSWTTGIIGKAVSFDGINDYVITTRTLPFYYRHNSTINLWFYANSATGPIFQYQNGQTLLCDDTQNTVGYVSGGVLKFEVWTGGISSLSTSLATTGIWHMLTAILTDSGMYFYLNGDLVDSSGTNFNQLEGDIAQPYVSFGAGSNNWEDFNSKHFDGIIDEVAIYNRALSALEVKNHYENGSNRFESQGNLTSKSIPLPNNMYWDTLIINKTEPQDTSLNITVLDGTTNQPIPSFNNLTGIEIDISSINPLIHKSIKLQAAFGSNGINTSILHDWSVNWTENTAPKIIDIISVHSVNRTHSTQLTINISDLEETEENLTLKVEYKSPSDDEWQTEYLIDACYTIDQWNCTFIPLKYADLGYYSFRFTVKDSFLSQNITTYPDLIEVINNKPTPPEVSILPTKPKTIDHLTVIAKNSTDIETLEEYLKYWYRWYINGSHLPIFDNKTIIPKEATKKYERWRCVVFPFDRDDMGIPGEAEITIQNSPPEIVEAFTSYEMYEDRLAILEDKLMSMFTDLDSDNLTFTATGQEHLEIEITQEDGTVKLTPAPNWFGTEYITFYANDSSPIEAEQTVEVTVHPTNDLPKIIQIGNQMISEDPSDLGFVVSQNEELHLRIVVDDPDGDVERGMIQYIFNKTETNNFYFQNSENKLIFQPDNADVGRHYIKISITDNNETPPEFISHDIWIEVLNVNDPPTVTITAPQTGREFLETEDIFFTCTADDPDLLIPQSTERFTFEWYTNRTSPERLCAGREITVTSRTLTPGYYTITVMVEDAAGEKGYDSVEIVIKGVPGKGGTTDGKGSEASDYLWLWVLIVVIIIIVICLLFLFLTKRKKRKLEEQGITDTEGQVLQPVSAYQPSLGTTAKSDTMPVLPVLEQFESAPSTAAITGPPEPAEQLPPVYATAPEPTQPVTTVSEPPTVGESKLTPQQKLAFLEKRLLSGEISEETYLNLKAKYEANAKSYELAPQLPPATATTIPEPPPISEIETPPETVTPTVDTPVMETEPGPTAELPPEVYVQPPQPTVAAPQPTVAPREQPIPTIAQEKPSEPRTEADEKREGEE